MAKNYNPVGILNMGKELKIDKCYRCGENPVYEGYVTCKSCIADTLIFS